MTCAKCRDEGWVCEEHPDKSWADGQCWFIKCGGAGMPCTCNTYDPPWHYVPPKWRKAANKEPK